MSKPYSHPFPPELIKHVTAICGARGVEWLERLPTIIAGLEDLWGIEAGIPFEKGEYNFVAAATRSAGTEAVLKIAPPYEQTEIHSEAEFLRSRDGNGSVRLIAEDRERFALLIERIRPGVTLDLHFASDPFACVEPAIDVLKSILAPPLQVVDVQSLDNWFDRFLRFRETDFPKHYGERAEAIYEKLRARTDRIFYLHGDFHPGNIVTAGRGSYLAIDPKGLIGHMSYDLAVFLNNLHWWQKAQPGVEAKLHTALKTFADAFNLKECELREACFAFMVIGAWWNFEDMPEHYDNEVALADVWDI